MGADNIKFINEDNNKHLIGVYMIKNIITNKCYIGMTRENFQERFWHHRWKLKDNSHDNMYLQNAWNKYGEDSFEFSVLQTVLYEHDINSLEDIEINWIKQYKENNMSYNMALGGGGKTGVPMSDDAKKIIGEKNRLHMTGRKHTDSTKKKMSQIRTGKAIDRVTNVINTDIAREIKQRLISGEKCSTIAKNMCVSYKAASGILSVNTWSHVDVYGWDEFWNNHLSKRPYRLKPQERDVVYDEYLSGVEIDDLAVKYNKTKGAIVALIKKKTNE